MKTLQGAAGGLGGLQRYATGPWSPSGSLPRSETPPDPSLLFKAVRDLAMSHEAMMPLMVHQLAQGQRADGAGTAGAARGGGQEGGMGGKQGHLHQ